MIEVEVEDPAWTVALAEAGAVARRAAEAALAPYMPPAPSTGFAGPSPPWGEELHGRDAPPLGELSAHHAAGASLTVLLTDDASVQALNREFRGKDAPTNVLSFPSAQTARPHIGDIALAYGVCAREAVAQGKPLGHHLAHLTVHGVLHLLGYDHQADAEACAMEALEGRVLERLGVSDPYARDDDG